MEVFLNVNQMYSPSESWLRFVLVMISGKRQNS